MEYGLIAAWISLIVLVYVLVALYLLTRYMVRACVNHAPPPVRLEVVVVEQKAARSAPKTD